MLYDFTFHKKCLNILRIKYDFIMHGGRRFPNISLERFNNSFRRVRLLVIQAIHTDTIVDINYILKIFIYSQFFVRVVKFYIVTINWL